MSNFDEFGEFEEGTADDDLNALAQAMFGHPGDTPQPAAPPPAASRPDPANSHGQTTESPVLAADGKTTIPYAVLRGERELSRSLAQRNRELEAQIARLSSAQAQPGNPPTDTEQLTEADMEEVEMESPPLAKLARGMSRSIDTVQQLVDQLTPMAQSISQQQTAERQRAELSVHEAIDQVPVIRYLFDTREANPEVFERARQIEAGLRYLPAFKDEPQASVKVLQAVQKELETEYGPISLPAEYQPTQDLRGKAEQAVKEAGVFVPRKLSDLEGGIPPEADHLRLSEMSENDLLSLYLKVGEAEYNRLIGVA